MNVAGVSLFQAGKDIFKDIGKYDLSGFAAQLAYRFFLALFPFFIFLAALGGFVADAFNVQNPTQEIMDLIGDSLPDDAASVVRGQLENLTGSQNPGLLSIGIIGAILAAAGGIGALVKGFNRIYEVEETRPMIARYALNISLTILGAGFILLAFLLLIVGQTYGEEIADELGLSSAASQAITIARYVVAVLFILLAVAFLYWAAPNVKLPFSLISPGAVFFAVGWLVTTFLFGIYVANFGNYNATYGALGGIVILLIWFYLTGFLLLLGAEINAYLARQKEPAEMERQGANVPGRPERERVVHGAHISGERPEADGARAGVVGEARRERYRGRRARPEPERAPTSPPSRGQVVLAGLVTAVALLGAGRALIAKES